MIYSCFDVQRGLYRYFEDGLTIPVNADLPVPMLPSSAGKIGVPAMEAARPLPPNARAKGTGHTARGILVQCEGSGLAFAGDASGSTWPPAWKWAVAIGAAALVVWAAQTKPVRSLVSGG